MFKHVVCGSVPRQFSSSPTVGILDTVDEPQSSDCDEVIGLGHHMATSRVDPCAFIW